MLRKSFPFVSVLDNLHSQATINHRSRSPSVQLLCEQAMASCDSANLRPCISLLQIYIVWLYFWHLVHKNVFGCQCCICCQYYIYWCSILPQNYCNRLCYNHWRLLILWYCCKLIKRGYPSTSHKCCLKFVIYATLVQCCALVTLKI